MVKETGEKTVFKDIFGNEFSQQKAREALPILVRQALISQKITYADLADELNMNRRNLNNVLGIIGNNLIKLSEEWKEEIPLINNIVINKSTGMPGDGFDYFLKNKDYIPSEKRQLLNEMLNDVFHYKKWLCVLDYFKLKQNTNPTNTFKKITNNGKSQHGSGESENHKRFKIFISENPKSIRLTGVKKGDIEHKFPSEDRIDVYFANENMVIGVEVKSGISDVNDILRGLFQCKKYEALIEAKNSVNGIRKQIMVILALENEFPNELLSIKNILSINVIDNIGKDKNNGA